MHTRFRSVAVPVLALVAACLVSASGQEAPTDPALHQRELAMVRSWDLIARYEEQRQDATALARSVLRLSREQEEEIDALARQQETKKAELLAALRAEYAQKVRGLLSEEQTERYDRVLEALDKLAAEVTTARNDLLEAVGAPGKQLADLPAHRMPIGDATRYLDLPREKRTALLKLRVEQHRALTEALQKPPAADTLQDPEAWREYRERYRELQKKMEEDYEAGCREILSEAEFQQLRRAEAALDRYRDRVHQARSEAYSRIRSALDGRPED